MPFRDAAHLDALQLAKGISNTFFAKITAYTEIWLNGKRLNPDIKVEEPIYGSQYLLLS